MVKVIVGTILIIEGFQLLMITLLAIQNSKLIDERIKLFDKETNSHNN